MTESPTIVTPQQLQDLCQEVLPMIAAMGVYLDKSRWQSKFLAAPCDVTSRFFEICKPCANLDQLGGCKDFGGTQEVTSFCHGDELLYVPNSVMSRFAGRNTSWSNAKIAENVGVWAFDDSLDRPLLTYSGVLGTVLKAKRTPFRDHVEAEICPSVKVNGCYLSVFLSEEEEIEALQILKKIDPSFFPIGSFEDRFQISPSKRMGRPRTAGVT